MVDPTGLSARHLFPGGTARGAPLLRHRASGPSRSRNPAGWTRALRSPCYIPPPSRAADLATDSRGKYNLGGSTVRSGPHGFLAGDRRASLPSRSSVVAGQVRAERSARSTRPVLLGLEFFLTHGIEFQLPLPPQDGSILLTMKIDSKLVSVDSLLMREKPGVNIPAHLGGETIPCSWSDRSAASRRARASASVWISPRR